MKCHGLNSMQLEYKASGYGRETIIAPSNTQVVNYVLIVVINQAKLKI